MALLDARDVVEEVGDVAGLGDTGEVIVGRPAGDKVSYVVPPRNARDMREAPATQVPALMAAIRGERGFMPTRDAKGVEYLAAYGPVGHLDWGVVAQIESKQEKGPPTTQATAGVKENILFDGKPFKYKTGQLLKLRPRRLRTTPR